MDYKISIYMMILLMLFVSVSAEGQTDSGGGNTETVTFSPLAFGFDKDPPIGTKFNIEGNIPANVIAVKMESFGFRSERDIPEGLRLGFHEGRSTCEVADVEDALKEVREDPKGKGIIYQRLVWEGKNDDNKFSFQHRMLYYGRSYLFFFTYYSELTSEKLDQMVGKSIDGLLDRSAELAESTGENTYDLVEKIINDLKLGTILDKDTGCERQVGDIVRDIDPDILFDFRGLVKTKIKYFEWVDKLPDRMNKLRELKEWEEKLTFLPDEEKWSESAEELIYDNWIYKGNGKLDEVTIVNKKETISGNQEVEEFQKSVEEGNICGLKSKFVTFGDELFSLSDCAGVKEEEEGVKWSITDNGKIYTVKKEGSEIHIYRNEVEEFQESIEQGNISELQSKFTTFGTEDFSLSDDAEVKVEKEGVKWSITDNNKIYIAKKEDSEIHIYFVRVESSRLNELESKNPAESWNQLLGKLKEVLERLEELEEEGRSRHIKHEDFIDLEGQLDQLLDHIEVMQNYSDILKVKEWKEDLESAGTAINDIVDKMPEFLDQVKNTKDRLKDAIVAQLPETYSRYYASTTASPYLDTVAERSKYFVSLDAGLMYVAQFQEVIPTVAVNIKLNQKDFDDPLDKSLEYSILLGFGKSKPDDLDPDYRGAFNGVHDWVPTVSEDDALLLALGIRSPKLSSLLRFETGVLYYRQDSRNPLEKDRINKGSLIFGLSLNWDMFDSLRGLFEQVKKLAGNP